MSVFLFRGSSDEDGPVPAIVHKEAARCCGVGVALHQHGLEVYPGAAAAAGDHRDGDGEADPAGGSWLQDHLYHHLP